jgi:hypothetical protein
VTLEKLPAVDVAPQLVSPVAVVANSAAVVVVPVVVVAAVIANSAAVVVVPFVVAAAVAVGAAADPAASVVDVAAAAAFPELPLGSPTYVSDWMGSCWRGALAMHKSCMSEAAQGRTRGT